jgi:hypothetical protein
LLSSSTSSSPSRLVHASQKENNIPAERPEIKEGSVSDEQVDKLKEEAQAAIDAGESGARDGTKQLSWLTPSPSTAEPLTEEEREEKSTLAERVFTNWNKPELRKFLELSGRYGRDAYTAIAAEMDNKTEEDLEAYAEVYWQRYKEIPGEAGRRLQRGSRSWRNTALIHPPLPNLLVQGGKVT